MGEGGRILQGAREALAIARGEMPGEDYAVSVPEGPQTVGNDRRGCVVSDPGRACQPGDAVDCRSMGSNRRGVSSV